MPDNHKKLTDKLSRRRADKFLVILHLLISSFHRISQQFAIDFVCHAGYRYKNYLYAVFLTHFARISCNYDNVYTKHVLHP